MCGNLFRQPVAFGKILPFARTESFRFLGKTSSGSIVHGTIYWIIKSIFIEYSVDRQFIYYGFEIPKICCSVNKMHVIEMFSAFDANTQFSSFSSVFALILFLFFDHCCLPVRLLYTTLIESNPYHITKGEHIDVYLSICAAINSMGYHFMLRTNSK